MYQESVLGLFGTMYCRPWTPPGLCPGHPGEGGLQRSPNTFIHALKTNLTHHSKFLKERHELPFLIFRLETKFGDIETSDSPVHFFFVHVLL